MTWPNAIQVVSAVNKQHLQKRRKKETNQSFFVIFAFRRSNGEKTEDQEVNSIGTRDVNCSQTHPLDDFFVSYLDQGQK